MTTIAVKDDWGKPRPTMRPVWIVTFLSGNTKFGARWTMRRWADSRYEWTIVADLSCATRFTTRTEAVKAKYVLMAEKLTCDVERLGVEAKHP